MASSRVRPIESTGVLPEDELRASQYRLLARFLAKPPDAGLLGLVGGFSGDDTELGKALALLARLARSTTPDKASEEYHDLFIGMGRGELLPYGSFYLTGFLNEKPLALLRRDMGVIGIARTKGTSEPEDHIAALAEMMAGLIMGDFGEPLSVAEQKRFFNQHLAPWAGRFFADLEKAKAAALYTPVGTLGRVFMEIETTAFAMAA
ncbi:MAG: molecular chaperone TorD family protein [Alphaproteobacteria bacterium]